ncbi:hypothetical protein V2J09_005927 [Rumex salicifolius]
MAGILMPQGPFAITPHKVSLCVLVQIYASPSPHFFLPEPFSSVSQHNRFGLFLLAQSKCCDDILEPKLDKLVSQLREINEILGQHLTDELTNKLSSLSFPDDLFNFFSELRGIVGAADSTILEDDQISLDPSSSLGTFVRRCLLAFNLLSFEEVCHLLSDIESYYREALPGSSFDLSHLDDPNNELKTFSEYENMDLENLGYEKVSEEVDSSKGANKEVPFHLHAPKAFDKWVEDADLNLRPFAFSGERSSFLLPQSALLDNSLGSAGNFLRTNWQMQQFLLEEADNLGKQGSSYPLNNLESTLRQLQKLAPELHCVHLLRYLNNLHHDDYAVSIILGDMKVLREAVGISQKQSNDSCLAYALTAICNLLSEYGITSTARVLGSSYSPVTGVSTSLTIQQQLFVLLKRCLHMAENLKLTQLVSANHLTLAKFGMRRPLQFFGPKTFLNLRTCPANVIKDLRLSCHVITECSSDNSIVSAEGAFSNDWLKNLQTPLCPLVLDVENSYLRDRNALQFCAQPSSIPGSLLQLVGSSCLLRTTAWEIYGSSLLAQQNALAYAANFANCSSLDDLALANVKLVQHLAVYKGYKEAFAAFKIVEEKFLDISRSRIVQLKLQLLHDLAIHRGHVNLAQQVCDELRVLASPVTGVDMELKVEASLRHARTLLAGKQYFQAAEVANSLFCMCYKFNLEVENATVLLLLAEIHKKSGNPVLALPYVLASLSFSQSYNLDLLKASASLTLAELWLSLGSCEAKRALNLLHSSFPMILGHGGLELRARAHILEAKCYLSDDSHSEDQNLVIDPLLQACEALEFLEYHELAVEAFYLLAIAYDKLGNVEERDKAANLFKEQLIALQNPQQGFIDSDAVGERIRAVGDNTHKKVYIPASLR